MSWASRRRTLYILGLILFLVVVVGIPAALILYEPPTCFDGKQNQEETAVDKGGPCSLLDERTLAPYSVQWSRSFPARDGAYSAVAMIENPNLEAGVRAAHYHFGLYDERNVLVAERSGTTFIMPGGVTPIFEGAIPAGNRAVAHTYFEFTSPLVWERMDNAARVLSVGNTNVSGTEEPRLSATVENTSVASVVGPTFVAVVSDPAGNAFAASATALARMSAGERANIVFTWGERFPAVVGRVDVLPALSPIPAGR